MKITIEFKDVNEYLEFKEKTSQDSSYLEKLACKKESKVCNYFPMLTPSPY